MAAENTRWARPAAPGRAVECVRGSPSGRKIAQNRRKRSRMSPAFRTRVARFERGQQEPGRERRRGPVSHQQGQGGQAPRPGTAPQVRGAAQHVDRERPGVHEGGPGARRRRCSGRAGRRTRSGRSPRRIAPPGPRGRRPGAAGPGPAIRAAGCGSVKGWAGWITEGCSRETSMSTSSRSASLAGAAGFPCRQDRALVGALEVGTQDKTGRPSRSRHGRLTPPPAAAKMKSSATPAASFAAACLLPAFPRPWCHEADHAPPSSAALLCRVPAGLARSAATSSRPMSWPAWACPCSACWRRRPPPAPGRKATARSCILLHQFGGPSHLDTFDPKPDAPAEMRGPFRPSRPTPKRSTASTCRAGPPLRPLRPGPPGPPPHQPPTTPFVSLPTMIADGPFRTPGEFAGFLGKARPAVRLKDPNAGRLHVRS